MSDGARRYRESIELHGRAVEVLAGGVSSNFRLGGSPAPLFFEKGSGAELRDADGNAYIDYALGMGPAILGHAPREVLEAVTSALEDGQLFAGQTRLELELATLVQRLVPSAERVRFGMSGSEMIQAAIRVARARTGRTGVVKFEGHYHGWFDSVYVNVSGPMDDRVPRTTRPMSGGQVTPDAASLSVLPWNDIDVVREFLSRHGSTTAAVLMEPILCNTSVIVPKPDYLAAVRAACTEHGVALIFDEVITGFRVALGGAQQLFGVRPDLTVFAKAMGGGFPVAALVGRAEMMDLFDSAAVVHGGTYNANMVSVSAALATLTGLAAHDGAAYRRIEQTGGALMDGLRVAGRADGLLVQGLPSVFNTTFGPEPDITDAKGYARSDTARQKRLLLELQHRGIRPTSRGTWFVSAAHTSDHVDRTIEAVTGALTAMRTSDDAVPVGVDGARR